MNMKDWLEQMPSVFPENMNYYEDNTYFQNPVIGDTREQTSQNIYQILSFFTQMALPSYTEKADFSLDEDSTWGFVRILQCMTGAIKFEEQHRANCTESVSNESVAREPNKN